MVPDNPAAKADGSALDTARKNETALPRPAAVRLRAADGDRHDEEVVASLAKQQGQVIALVADALDQHGYESAALAVATELAALFDCQRVSIGTFHGKRLNVDALSNASDFEVKSSLARRLALAMEEACSQGDTVIIPEPADCPMVSSAHAELARTNGSQAICTVPLVAHEQCVGAVVLERTQACPFTAQEVGLAENACMLLTPILQLKRRVEDPLLKRCRESLTALTSKILGPQHLAGKLITVVLLCLISILVTVNGRHEVTSTALLEPDDVRTVVSPTRGFISKVHAHAGDTVDAGAPLAELDQRDLRLELEKREGELSKNAKERQSALAARDRSRMRVLKSQEQQINAQIRLVETLIERGQLTAPVAGVIIATESDYSYGSPIERGEVLFEIATLTAFDLILEVDERDIANVHEADEGKLVLTTRPGEVLPFRVSRIVPISESSAGATKFRVEAQLQDVPDWIRPGMSGISKISVGERKLLWIWTHRIVEAVQMRWWRWGWL